MHFLHAPIPLYNGPKAGQTEPPASKDRVKNTPLTLELLQLSWSGVNPTCLGQIVHGPRVDIAPHPASGIKTRYLSYKGILPPAGERGGAKIDPKNLTAV